MSSTSDQFSRNPELMGYSVSKWKCIQVHILYLIELLPTIFAVVKHLCCFRTLFDSILHFSLCIASSNWLATPNNACTVDLCGVSMVKWYQTLHLSLQKEPISPTVRQQRFSQSVSQSLDTPLVYQLASLLASQSVSHLQVNLSICQSLCHLVINQSVSQTVNQLVSASVNESVT